VIEALEITFWVAVGLIVWTQVGYGVFLWLLARLIRRAETPGREPRGAAGAAGREGGSELPSVTLVVAAHNEQAVIADKVANLRSLAYPRERTQVIVACDGCTDETARRARAAGADLVLELPRGGKVRAQDAAVERARGELVAFSDANCTWERYALRALVSAFDDPRVGYACGQVRYRDPARRAGDTAHGQPATSQEGVYWRYELGLRSLESRLASVTGGNGGIYATRRASYIVVDPVMGHDLSFPFNMVKRGQRAVYVPAALAIESMVPSIEGEFARKRRMMSHTWPIVLRTSMLAPRGYSPLYWLMILSHRALRYATPALHVIALAANLAAVFAGAGLALLITLWLQGALIIAAALGAVVPVRPLLIARHYVLSTAALALGLWDWLVHGTSAAWQAAEGTRPQDTESAQPQATRGTPA
jgi:cellulose synthase/poly-beta-1,6-N-acetylglucosamine synthase-like glycosyltransferase